MATEFFSAKHTAGLGDAAVYFIFFDTSQGAGVNLRTFDFNDGSWKATKAACTTPELFGTEKTDPGDADESIYVASTDLSNMNGTTTPLKVLVQVVHDLATDEIISESEFVIVNGAIVEQTGDSFARVGAPAGASISADVAAIPTVMVGTNNAALAATALSTAQWTNARAVYLDELLAANLPADVDALLARLTAARAVLLDNLVRLDALISTRARPTDLRVEAP